jgi:hypothetical protein
MKKQQTLFKQSPQVRKQIMNLADTLPAIPSLIQDAEGYHTPQQMKTSRLVKGVDIKNEIVEGQPVDVKKNYIQRGTQTRKVNHRVNLFAAYSQSGQNGIDGYVAHINQLHQIMEDAKKQQSENKTVELISEKQDVVTD